MKNYLKLSSSFVAAVFALMGQSARAEQVCSYSNGIATVCCDTETEYCDGFPAYGRQVWEDVQGRWKGTVRLYENTCRYKNGVSSVQDLDVRVKALTEYNPDEDNLLSGRTQARRYTGSYTPPAGIDDPLTNFETSEAVRLLNGTTCRRIYTIEFDYFGGRTTSVTASQEIRCSGFFVCKTVRKGKLRKTTKVARK